MDIIELAKQAGFFVVDNEVYSPSNQADHELTGFVESFANLVATAARADERDFIATKWENLYGYDKQGVAEFIRKRANTQEETNMTGYPSKKKAAQDKLNDDDALTIAYQSGYYDGKKAAQPAQEPVYSDIVSDGGLDPRNKFDAQPPQRPWVGLTDDDIKILWKATPQLVGVYSYTDIAKEVEATLRSKNK